jgi:hypothetical protein
MRVIGVSLVANAVRLDFPIREAIRSILPLCDEVLVNVGPSDDGTRKLLAGMGAPGVRLLDGEWDRGQGGRVLAVETQRALDQARGDWAVYIQADEVLHEEGLAAFRAALAAAHDDPRVEGLLVDYRHFYGGPGWVGGGRRWYRREVRAVRLGRGARSHEEAQGFRMGSEGRKVRARRSGATYHHYGWARPIAALQRKREADNALYYGGLARRAPIGERLPWDVGLRPYHGTHPAVMREWLAERAGQETPGFAARPWDLRRVALHASSGLERLTGWRPFEFRNYVEV